jgi:uncharacterized protein YndB with AHSA1/START domain
MSRPGAVAGRMLGGEVDFDVPVDVAFAYLADPRNRPEWQSSLARVEMLDSGEPRVGMRWRDHTKARIVPTMEITTLEPGQMWAESGQWHAVTAVLVLDFAATQGGCQVGVAFRVTGRGPWWALGWVATAAGVLPVLADVRRAARILAERRGD